MPMAGEPFALKRYLLAKPSWNPDNDREQDLDTFGKEFPGK